MFSVVSYLSMRGAMVVKSWREETFADFGDLGEIVRTAWEVSPNRDWIDLEEIEETIEQHRQRNERKLQPTCDWQGRKESVISLKPSKTSLHSGSRRPSLAVTEIR